MHRVTKVCLTAIVASPSITRVEDAYRSIRADVLAGRLPPGSRLPFAELTERYGKSISVIREALTRLTAQGLVVSEPQHGFRVTPISLTDLADLTTARCEIEGAALRLAIEHGDLVWESRVVAAQHALDRTPQWTDGGDEREPVLTEEWAAAHAEYHDALIAGCPSARLIAAASSLRASAELYRRWSQPASDVDLRDVRAEHRALTEATVSRDSIAAHDILINHLDGTRRLLSERAVEHGLDVDASPPRAG